MISSSASRHRTALAVLLAAGVLGLPARAGADGGKKEAQAKKALKQALEEDYLNTRFDAAELKLRAAIQGCGKVCSAALRARLHLALGSVLAGGKKELEDARDEFIEALGLDPKIEPSPDFLSTEVSFAYEQARKRLKLAAGRAPPPDDKPARKPEREDKDQGGGDDRRDQGEPEDKPKDPKAAAEPVRKNWITISFAPDFAVVAGTDVCTGQSQQSAHYVCLRADSTRYVGTPTLGNADNILPGLTVATLRVMLGYDRLVHPNITLGSRVGFAFDGASGGGSSFFPVHIEARLGIWPGHDPFAGKGVRPMILVSGGVEQVDAKVNVPVLEDGNACGANPPSSTTSKCTMPSSDGVVEQRQQTLTVYRQNGLGFAAGTVGVQFAPSTRVALHLAVRGSVTFPAVAAVFSPEAGMSVGF